MLRIMFGDICQIDGVDVLDNDLDDYLSERSDVPLNLYYEYMNMVLNIQIIRELRKLNEKLDGI